MATRSLIAIEHEDGSIESIYCHNNGDIDLNGAALLDDYQTAEDVSKLIALGDMSSILPEPMAYHRDLEEEWDDVKPRIFPSLTEYLSVIPKRWNDVNYVYIFTKDNLWTVYRQSCSKGIGEKQRLIHEYTESN